MANERDPIFDYDDSEDAKAFDAPVHNYEKARKPVLKILDRAKDVFESATPVKGRKPISMQNDRVRLHLPFSVNGKSYITRKAEEFGATLSTLYQRVSEGVYDEAIKLGIVDGKSGGNRVAEDRAGYTAEPRKKRAPMSPEAKAAMNAKRLATMAQRGTKPGRKILII